jgi:hypothetical protein
MEDLKSTLKEMVIIAEIHEQTSTYEIIHVLNSTPLTNKKSKCKIDLMVIWWKNLKITTIENRTMYYSKKISMWKMGKQVGITHKELKIIEQNMQLIDKALQKTY